MTPEPFPAWEYMLRMTPQAGAVGVARAAVRAALGVPAAAGLRDDAALIASELVTNAVRHAAGSDDVGLRLRWSGAVLEITVDDNDPSPPRARRSGLDAVSGRGLLIVDALAQSWGCGPAGGGGKLVWARLAGRDR